MNTDTHPPIASAPWVAAVLTLALSLAGCSGWGEAQIRTVGAYHVAIKTDPHPLQVGRAAEMTVSLTYTDAEAASGCGLRMRQYMPGMEMGTDQQWVPLSEVGEAIYEGRSHEFGMGGDWQLELEFRCGDDQHTVRFDYHLVWPD